MGTTFENYGFLADDDLGFSEFLESQHGAHIDLAKELNQFAQELQYKLEIHNEYVPELLGSTLYSNFVASYQAAILLSLKGMKHQFYSQIRCMLEPLFPLVAISKDLEFANALVLAEEIERKKNINKFIRYCERNGITGEDFERAKALHEVVGEKIEKENIKKISIYECAEKAGLEDWYDTLYSHTSSYLHISVRSLEESLILDEDQKKIEALKSEPDCDGFDMLYTTTMQCMLTAIQAVCVIFELDEPPIIETLSEKLMKLNETHA